MKIETQDMDFPIVMENDMSVDGRIFVRVSVPKGEGSMCLDRASMHDFIDCLMLMAKKTFVDDVRFAATDFVAACG